jgi:hypothetical protein
MGRPRIICPDELCQLAHKAGINNPYAFLAWKKNKIEMSKPKQASTRKRMKDKRGNYVTKREVAENCFKLLGIPMLDEYVPTKRGGVALTSTGLKVLETEIAAMVIPIRDREILVEELMAIVEELNELSAEENLTVKVTFHQE